MQESDTHSYYSEGVDGFVYEDNAFEAPILLIVYSNILHNIHSSSSRPLTPDMPNPLQYSCCGWCDMRQGSRTSVFEASAGDHAPRMSAYHNLTLGHKQYLIVLE